ncbi:MAG: nucleoside 2-deoxyribosyltransferase [Candidatus Rokubacteria bacterium]|nr:nucleoside 2-deoxyribosyltransferase [Candidatus Rokubacteria bacterium]
MARVYVASPLGFAESSRLFYTDRLLPLLRGLGHDILDPWALTDVAAVARVAALPWGVERYQAWRRLDTTIAETNRRAIEEADALVAVLDGPDVDSGTAAEIGFACGQGKPIVGYRGDTRRTGENEGVTVNLLVEYFIRASGGTIVTQLDEIAGALAAALTVSERGKYRGPRHGP